MNNQKKANNLLEKAVKMVEDAGISPGKIEKNVRLSKAKKTWGTCKKKHDTQTYEISIMEKLLESEEGSLNTMIHEVLHTCEGCMNHGKTWKKYAEKIRRIYNIEITRTSSRKGELTLDLKNDSKYHFKCESCNMDIFRTRKSKFTENYQNYRCRCRGKIVKVDAASTTPT